jgi:hypothetical protein
MRLLLSTAHEQRNDNFVFVFGKIDAYNLTPFFVFATILSPIQSELRVRHREECKNVTKLTMENVSDGVSYRTAIYFITSRIMGTSILWFHAPSGVDFI